MVQLKGSGAITKTIARSVFQFLMVQLKDMARIEKQEIYIFQFLMVQLKENENENGMPAFVISIPYGSIKRLRQGSRQSLRSRFQFLMVQLKEISSGSEFLKDKISIPYGSIKRETLLAFQGLIADFNSLWFN